MKKSLYICRIVSDNTMSMSSTLISNWLSKSVFYLKIIIINPILIWVYPLKRQWLGSLYSNSNLINSHSPSHSIHGLLILQTNTFALLHLSLEIVLFTKITVTCLSKDFVKYIVNNVIHNNFLYNPYF